MDAKNGKKTILVLGKIIVVVLSLYCFFNPTTITFGGYSLAVDGTVVARTMCLLFALYIGVSTLEDLCSK